jgi:hypothetical protein
MRRFRRSAPEDVHVPVTPRANAAISFWAEHFPKWNRRSKIFLGFGPSATWQALALQDASTRWGCGGVLFIGGRLFGYNHQWSNAERAEAVSLARESTGVLEVHGAKHCLVRYARRCEGLRLELDLDNESSVWEISAGYSPVLAMMDAIKVIRALCVEFSIALRVRHILGVRFNRIADALAKNDFPQARCAAQDQIGLALEL